MLSDPRFCCLLFESVTIYHCPSKQLICYRCFAHVHSVCNSIFPEEAISEVAQLFLFPLPCIYYDISMGLCFCISFWTELIYSSSFSEYIQTLQVIFLSHALQVPTVDEY